MKDPVEVADRGLSSVVVESTILFLFWILPDFPLLWMEPLGADSSDSAVGANNVLHVEAGVQTEGCL